MNKKYHILIICLLVLCGVVLSSYKDKKTNQPIEQEQVLEQEKEAEQIPQIAPNEFAASEMEKKVNERVGGMELVSAEKISNRTIYSFQGEVSLNADFSNSILFLGSRGPSDEYFCFFGLNDTDSKKVPRILIQDEYDVDIGNYLCVKGNLRDFPKNSYGNADIRIDKLMLVANNSEDGGRRRDAYCKDYQKYVSVVNVVDMKNVKKYDENDRSTWRSYNYSFDDGSVLKFLAKPNYDFHANENGFTADENKKGNCSEFGDYEGYIGLKIGKNKSISEYLDGVEYYEGEFYNFKMNEMRGASNCGNSLFPVTLIEKGDYFLEAYSCPSDLIDNLLFSNSSTSPFDKNSIDCLGSDTCNQIMSYRKR